MRIIQGDCTQKLLCLKDSEVDLIVTSPPYYNAKDYSVWPSYASYLDFLRDVFTKAYRVLKDGRMCCVNISVVIEPREHRRDSSKRIAIPFHFVNLMEDIGFVFLEDIVWVKPDGCAKNRNGGFYRSRKPIAYKPNIVNEYVFVFQKPMNGLIDDILKKCDKNLLEISKVKEDYERTNVWYIQPETKIKHPAPFPVKLSDRLIKYYSFVGDTVLDMFMGSGTTAVSAKKLNRECIGIELHSKYIDLMHTRLQNLK